MSRSDTVLQEHLSALSDFERDYGAYISELEVASARGAQRPGMSERRWALIRRVSRAALAMDAAGVRLAFTPPPMFGGPVSTDFASQIMAHETSTYGSGPDPLATARMVLDGLTAALGSLENQLAEAQTGQNKLAVQRPRRRVPTVVGHIHFVPKGIAIFADVGGAVGFTALLGKLIGFW